MDEGPVLDGLGSMRSPTEAKKARRVVPSDPSYALETEIKRDTEPLIESK